MRDPLAVTLADIAARLSPALSVPVAVLREADDQPGTWLYHVREGDPTKPMQRLTEEEFDGYARGRPGPAFIVRIERRPPLLDGGTDEQTILNIGNVGGGGSA